MNAVSKIKTEFQTAIDVYRRLLDDEDAVQKIAAAAELMIATLRCGGKILVCGNGGSASDAIHFAGELTGRFQRDRKPYAAVALNTDVAAMTAIANDYGFDYVFARQVDGLMREGDLLVGISTSGMSPNVEKAMRAARDKGGRVVLLSGRDGGVCRSLADISVVVPSDVTAHIQEAHECIYHIWCGCVESALE